MHCVISYCNLSCCITSYCITMYCTKSYCTVWYHIISSCMRLYYVVLPHIVSYRNETHCIKSHRLIGWALPFRRCGPWLLIPPSLSSSLQILQDRESTPVPAEAADCQKRWADVVVLFLLPPQQQRLPRRAIGGPSPRRWHICLCCVSPFFRGPDSRSFMRCLRARVWHTLGEVGPPQAAGGRQLSCIVKGGRGRKRGRGHICIHGEEARVCFLFVPLIKVPASWTAPRRENCTL